MSYSQPPSGYLVPEQPGGKPARPGTVTFASLLLWLSALMSLISAGLAVYSATLSPKDKIVTILRDGGYPADQAGTAADITIAVIYIAACISLVFALLFMISAISVGRGKQWARILAWVIGGISICCGVLGVAGSALNSTMSGLGGTSTEGIDSEKIAADTAALMPSWMTPLNTGLGIVELIAAILFVILLALPPSHPFFRKEEPVWTPPTYPAP